MTETLQEYVDSGGATLRVDREAGVLRGVKLIGLHSQNGRRYRDAALANAKRLYESAKVNVNHSRAGAAAPRDYQDRLGVIRHVEHRQGEGLFGELHFNPKHALAEQLVWDAQHNPANVGLSHNVLALTSRDGADVVVEEITRVQSVDLVADPATTRGLFEQSAAKAAGDPPQRWQDVTIEALRAHRPDLYQALIESAEASVERELCDLQAAQHRREQENRIAQAWAECAPAGLLDTGNVRKALGEALFETLLTVEDDRRLRRLLQERAEIAQRSIGGAADVAHQPRSVEQNGDARRADLIEGAADFARAMRTPWS